jgi:hypothetical protein
VMYPNPPTGPTCMVLLASSATNVAAAGIRADYVAGFAGPAHLHLPTGTQRLLLRTRGLADSRPFWS